MTHTNLEKPNLIYVFVDQLRYQSCGFAGDPVAKTPNIDRFAAESVNFNNAVSGYPVCAPYRASLFTGKYPSSTGMVINELRCMPDPDAIGHVLTNSGYQTGYIGKWHIYANSTDHSPERQYVPPGPYRLGFDGYWATYNFNHNYYDGIYYENSDEPIFIDGYEPTMQTDLAVNYLQNVNKDQPFAMFLSYGIPHDPWEPDNCPEEYIRMFDDVDFPDPPNYRDGSADEYWGPRMDEQWFQDKWKPYREQYRKIYYAMTASADDEFGRLLDEIERLNLKDNTIVVFTSDHGELFGAHGRIAKKIFYEEAVRVPFLIRWPGQIPSNTSDACLNTPDIMPTLLDLMGLDIPESVEGMSLKEQALGKTGPEPEAAFMQGMGHTFLWRDGDEWRALRDKQFTYAKMRKDGSEYLFNHQEDPYQLTNLIDDPHYTAQVEKYRAMLAERMALLNDTFESCTWYGDHWVEDRVIKRSATRSL